MAIPVLQTGTGNVTSAATTAGTSVTVTKPANVVSGDLLLAFGTNRNQTVAMTSTGWTEVVPTSEPPNLGTPRFLYRIAGASEAASYTFASGANASGRMVVLVQRVTGYNAGTVLDVIGAIAEASPATQVDAPSVTTVSADTLVIAGLVAQTSAGAAQPWGFTTTSDMTLQPKVTTGSTAASSSAIQLATLGKTSAGATGAKTFTAEGTTASGSGYLIAIKPAAVSNAAPTVNAGPDQTVEPWTTVTLTGTATDTDGSIGSQSWTGPVTLAGTGPTRTFTAPAAMTDTDYTFTYSATDNGGSTSTDTVVITVKAATEGWVDTGGVIKPLRIDWV